MDLSKLYPVEDAPDRVVDGIPEITRRADMSTAQCPKCHSHRKTPLLDKEEPFFHIDINGKLIKVIVKKRKYKCLDCKKIYTHDLGEPIKHYTREFCEHIIDRIEKGDKYSDFKRDYKLSNNNYKKIIEWYYNQEKEGKGYILPPFIVIVKKKIANRDAYLIFDLLEMTLLDILEEKKLYDLVDFGSENVREVFLYDFDTYNIAKIHFPNAGIYYFSGLVKKELLEGLLRDARRLDIADYEADIEKIILDGDEEELKKALRYDMGIVGIMANLKNIKAFLDGDLGIRLPRPVGNVPNYIKAYEKLQDRKRFYGSYDQTISNRILNQMVEKLEKFLREIEDRNKRIAFESQVGKILFEGDFVPKIEEEGEILRNSGRRI